jgi:hypothetical protein
MSEQHILRAFLVAESIVTTDKELIAKYPVRETGTECSS